MGNARGRGSARDESGASADEDRQNLLLGVGDSNDDMLDDRSGGGGSGGHGHDDDSNTNISSNTNVRTIETWFALRQHPPSSALSSPRIPGEPPRTPRTPRSVRFNLEPTVVEPAPPPPSTSFEIEYPANGDDDDDEYARLYNPRDGHDGGDDDTQPRRPLLLTDREAPSVTLANSSWAARSSMSSLDEAYYDEDTILGRNSLDARAEAERERARPRSGMRSAFVNMANSIIGAGIIGQPYAMRQAGLLSGVVLLVVLTIVVDWTIRLIVINSKLSGSGSFQGTVERCFGRPGLVAISLAQWLFAFGGMVAFGVIVGDSIPHVLLAIWPGLGSVPVLGWLADRRGAIVVFVMGVSLPLTLYRDISKLAKASMLALVSMIVILVTVVVQGALAPEEARGKIDSSLLIINDGIFQAIGVISFAFVCHHNSLLIYGSLKTPTIDRFALVTHLSTAISMLACLAMALCGFLVFGDRTLGNVLNNLPADNTMANVARLCFGLNMLTTLPLEAFVCREVMLNYYAPGKPFQLVLHVALSAALVGGAVALSLVTCDLGAVFELVGATSACTLAYILPPLCYIRLTTRSWKTYAAGGVVVFGCVVLAISVVQALQKMITGDPDAVTCS